MLCAAAVGAVRCLVSACCRNTLRVFHADRGNLPRRASQRWASEFAERDDRDAMEAFLRVHATRAESRGSDLIVLAR